MKGKLMTFMILFIALDETVAIYWLIVALQILGVDPASMTNPHAFISAWLAVGLPWIAVGIWEGYVAKTAVENMGKNPEISSTLMVLTILGMALVESAAIYWLVVAFDLLWA
jgi:F-type H+-transporting ATPase subunit c